MLGVVAHGHRALRHLTLGGSKGLAHLPAQHLSDHGDFTLEEFSGSDHQMRPLDKAGRPPERGALRCQ